MERPQTRSTTPRRAARGDARLAAHRARFAGALVLAAGGLAGLALVVSPAVQHAREVGQPAAPVAPRPGSERSVELAALRPLGTARAERAELRATQPDEGPLDARVALESEVLDDWLWRLGRDHVRFHTVYAHHIRDLVADESLSDAARFGREPCDLTYIGERSRFAASLSTARARTELERLLAEADACGEPPELVLADLSRYLRGLRVALLDGFGERQVDQLWVGILDDHAVLAPASRDYERLLRAFLDWGPAPQRGQLERPWLWTEILGELEVYCDQGGRSGPDDVQRGRLVTRFFTPFTLVDAHVRFDLNEPVLWSEWIESNPCFLRRQWPRMPSEILIAKVADLSELRRHDLQAIVGEAAAARPDLDRLEVLLKSRVARSRLQDLRRWGGFADSPLGRRALLEDLRQACVQVDARLERRERPPPSLRRAAVLRLYRRSPSSPLVLTVCTFEGDERRDPDVGTRVLDPSLAPFPPGLRNLPGRSSSLVVLQVVEGRHLRPGSSPFAGVLRGGIHEGPYGPVRSNDARFADSLARLIEEHFVDGPGRGRLGAEALDLVAGLRTP